MEEEKVFQQMVWGITSDGTNLNLTPYVYAKTLTLKWTIELNVSILLLEENIGKVIRSRA